MGPVYVWQQAMPDLRAVAKTTLTMTRPGSLPDWQLAKPDPNVVAAAVEKPTQNRSRCHADGDKRIGGHAAFGTLIHL